MREHAGGRASTAQEGAPAAALRLAMRLPPAMTPQLRLALALVALALAVLAALALVAGGLWAELDAAERAAALAALETRSVQFVLLLAVAAGGVAFAFAPFLRRAIAGPAKLAERARIALAANRAYRLRQADTPELGSLARLFDELADQRDALQGDVERRIRDAQAELEAERNRLAALLAELAEGIVVCNLDGRILLYNNRARLHFSALAQRGAALGLGRSIFGFIDAALLDHALDTIRRRQGSGQRAIANFITPTRAGPLIRVQMAPVPAAAQGELAGYVLVLENITRRFEAESRRDEALHALTEGSRAALANIRAAVETLAGYPDIDAAQRERFVGVIADEVHALSARLDASAARYAEALKARSVLEEMRGADLVAATQRTIETKGQVAVQAAAVAPALWVMADSFTLIRALAALAARLHACGVRELRLQLAWAGERLAQLDLEWPAPAVPLDALRAWECEPMQLGAGTASLRDVAERHDGEAWFHSDGDSSGWRLLLPLASAQPEAVEPQPLGARPEYYDFALFERAGAAHALDERPLAELSYTVFDTETTGLAPDDGDEIIQIGAVRIVNARLLRQDCFEQLVDPRRRVGREAALVHGIGDDQLRGQPTIDEVLPAFHAFCEDTVLVGHNAAFDMRFLRLKEASAGVRFEQPLLDTLLLSEVIQPAQDAPAHRLEAIAERLGVRIESRHDALADATVTAEVFLRMIGLLADAGIRTLRDAREASAKTRYAKVQY